MAQTISVTISDHWLRFVNDGVSDRRYGSIDDAVAAGLRALEAEQARAEQLDRLLAEGEASGDAGPWDLRVFLEERHDEAGREAA